MDSRRKNGCLGLLSALLKLLVLLRPCEADHSSSLSVVVKKQPHLYAPHSTHGLLTQHTLTFKSRCGSTTKTQLGFRPELCARDFRPYCDTFLLFRNAPCSGGHFIPYFLYCVYNCPAGFIWHWTCSQGTCREVPDPCW